MTLLKKTDGHNSSKVTIEIQEKIDKECNKKGNKDVSPADETELNRVIEEDQMTTNSYIKAKAVRIAVQKPHMKDVMSRLLVLDNDQSKDREKNKNKIKDNVMSSRITTQ